MPAFLDYRDRDGRERVFAFEPGADAATVGRRSSSDLVLDWDDQVSRLHARFERTRDAWEVVDDGLSSNGTFVNEQRVTGRRRLHDGDRIRFGGTTTTFRSPVAQPPPPPPPPPSPEPRRSQEPRRSDITLSSTQRRVLAALCGPYKGRSPYAEPASDEQIAEQLFLSVGEVKAHVRVLSVKLGLGDASQPDTRHRIVRQAFATGLVTEHDL